MRGEVPPSKRSRLAGALDRLGVLDRLLWLRGRLGLDTLAVLTYHRVGYPGGDEELAQHVIEVTPEELADQLALLRERCTLVRLADLRRFRQGARVPPNPVLITFDDGYADNYEIALPILERAGAPAVFFIPTAYPDAGRLFYWDRIELLMRRSRTPRVEIAYPRRLVLGPWANPRAAARLLGRAINASRGVSFERLWEELERALHVSLDPEEERALAKRTIMGWSAIRALADAGMEVESHSHQHLVLNTLSPEEARRDLARSAAVLGEVLERRVRAVAYPVGYDLGQAHRAAVKATGFDLGFTNGTGLGRASEGDPLSLPRLSMDLATVSALYKMLLVLGNPILPAGRPAPF